MPTDPDNVALHGRMSTTHCRLWCGSVLPDFHCPLLALVRQCKDFHGPTRTNT